MSAQPPNEQAHCELVCGDADELGGRFDFGDCYDYNLLTKIPCPNVNCLISETTTVTEVN